MPLDAAQLVLVDQVVEVYLEVPNFRRSHRHVHGLLTAAQDRLIHEGGDRRVIEWPVRLERFEKAAGLCVEELCTHGKNNNDLGQNDKCDTRRRGTTAENLNRLHTSNEYLGCVVRGASDEHSVVFGELDVIDLFLVLDNFGSLHAGLDIPNTNRTIIATRNDALIERGPQSYILLLHIRFEHRTDRICRLCRQEHENQKSSAETRTTLRSREQYDTILRNKKRRTHVRSLMSSARL